MLIILYTIHTTTGILYFKDEKNITIINYNVQVYWYTTRTEDLLK